MIEGLEEFGENWDDDSYGDNYDYIDDERYKQLERENRQKSKEEKKWLIEFDNEDLQNLCIKLRKFINPDDKCEYDNFYMYINELNAEIFEVERFIRKMNKLIEVLTNPRLSEEFKLKTFKSCLSEYDRCKRLLENIKPWSHIFERELIYFEEIKLHHIKMFGPWPIEEEPDINSFF